MNMLRWRSDEALRIYARLNDFEYATWLDVASSATISSIRAANLPPAVGTAAERAAQQQREWLQKAAAVDVEPADAARIPHTDCDALVGALADGLGQLMRAAAAADAED